MDSVLVVAGGIAFFVGVFLLVASTPLGRLNLQFTGAVLIVWAIILWATAAATNGTTFQDLCQENKIEDCKGYE